MKYRLKYLDTIVDTPLDEAQCCLVDEIAEIMSTQPFFGCMSRTTGSIRNFFYDYLPSPRLLEAPVEEISQSFAEAKDYLKKNMQEVKERYPDCEESVNKLIGLYGKLIGD